MCINQAQDKGNQRGEGWRQQLPNERLCLDCLHNAQYSSFDITALLQNLTQASLKLLLKHQPVFICSDSTLGVPIPYTSAQTSKTNSHAQLPTFVLVALNHCGLKTQYVASGYTTIEQPRVTADQSHPIQYVNS